jgi:hypothetical protein
MSARTTVRQPAIRSLQLGYGVGAACETCGLNSGNLNILSEARIHTPELISDQVSVDPIDEVLCSFLVSREVRR